MAARARAGRFDGVKLGKKTMAAATKLRRRTDEAAGASTGG